MSIILKTEKEIALMREGGKILYQILHALKSKVAPGIKTIELERYSEELFKKYKVLPSFKGYNSYPATICTAVNEEVVHTIPGQRILQEGDIISIDAGVFHKNLHTDSAITVQVGKVAKTTIKFVETCEEALSKAIEKIKPGIHLVEISGTIQDIVEKNGYSIVKNLIGHGVGHKLHEDPEVLNFRTNQKGPILKPGLTIAIEPIITMGKGAIETLKDGWTIVTKDKSLAVQVEHTIAVTNTGYQILTRK